MVILNLFQDLNQGASRLGLLTFIFCRHGKSLTINWQSQFNKWHEAEPHTIIEKIKSDQGLKTLIAFLQYVYDA